MEARNLGADYLNPNTEANGAAESVGPVSMLGGAVEGGGGGGAAAASSGEGTTGDMIGGAKSADKLSDDTRTSYDIFDDGFGSVDECRVCRGGAEPGRQLYSPCLCSGSIKHCHQDCLEEWLRYSKKEARCEVCKTSYTFDSIYAENAPASISNFVMLRLTLKRLALSYAPQTARVLLSLAVYLVVVPLLVAASYRVFVKNPASQDPSWLPYSFSALSEMSFKEFYLALFEETVSGLLLMLLVVASSFFMLPFIDFLQFNWNVDAGRNERGAGAGVRARMPPRRIQREMQMRRQMRQRQIPPGGRLGLGAPRRGLNGENGRGGDRRAAFEAAMQAMEQINNNLNEQRLREAGAPRDDLGDDAQRPRNAREMIRVARRHQNQVALDEAMHFAAIDALLRRQEAGDPNAVVELQRLLDDFEARRAAQNRNNDDEEEEEDDREDEDGAEDEGAGPQEEEEYRVDAPEDVPADVPMNEEEDGNDEQPVDEDDAIVADVPGEHNQQAGNREHGDEDEEDEEWEDVMEQNENPDRVDDIEVVENGAPIHVPPAPAAVNNPPAARNPVAFVDDDGILDDPGPIADQREVIEIGININGLVGLRSLLVGIFIIAFITIYFTCFGSLPLSLGFVAQLYLSSQVSKLSFLSFILDYIPLAVKEFVNDLLAAGAQSHNILMLQDFIKVVAGYVVVSGIVFLISTFFEIIDWTIWKMAPNYQFPRSCKLSMHIVRICASLVKVFILIFIRIFWLPFTIGCGIVFLSNSLFEFTREQWINFIVNNIIGFGSVAWVTGIVFMLTNTMSILQLREVLHPAVLARKVRPQDTHIEMLNALINDSGIVHTRRLASSLLIYFFLVVIFFWLPISIVKEIMGHPVSLLVHYNVPKLSIPFEMAMFYFFFLSLLEADKDKIGQFQHSWLVYTCKKFGLTRYLLPVVRENTTDGPRETVLVRPPSDWDARIRNIPTTAPSSRWSFDAKAQTDLEKSLLDRETPAYVISRCVGLAVVTWLVVFSAIIGTLATIIAVGRFSTYSIIRALPAWLPVGVHDPLCLFIGLRESTVVLYIIIFVVDNWSRMKLVVRVVPINIYRKFVTILASTCVALPFSVGLCCRKLCRSDVAQDEATSPIRSFLHDLVAGHVICLIVLLFLTQNRVVAFLDRAAGTTINGTLASFLQGLQLFIASAVEVIDSHENFDPTDGTSPPRLLFCEPLSQAEVDANAALNKFEVHFLFPVTSFFFKAIVVSMLGAFVSRLPAVASSAPLKTIIQTNSLSQLLCASYVIVHIRGALLSALAARLGELRASLRDELYIVGKKLRNYSASAQR